jgi:hypothetical protein
LGLVGVIHWSSRKPQENAIPQSPAIAEGGQSSQSNENKQAAQIKPSSLQAASNSNPAVPDAVKEYVKKSIADPQYDWKQPINFYGRVVDEVNNPVAGASVHFNWTDLSPTGTSHADKTSDGNGFFSLTGEHGKRMSVTVSKEGYYTYPSERLSSYEYANPADGLFKPDPMYPVVFHLRKKGVGVDLVSSHSGINPDLHIAPPTNGSPLFLDLLNCAVGNDGQLKIEGWKELKDFKTAQNNWGFRLTVPDGGLIEENDEFPFEAPNADADYQSVMEWHFKNGDPDWKGSLKKSFYIKFGNPPRYGIVSVQTTAFAPGVYLNYLFNPTGSRNLEPK